jgi:hypothetical protein
MEKIDIKYKIPLTGKYNAGISRCLECDCNLLDHPKHGNTYQHIIGFANASSGYYAIVECPECFEKWYFHARTYGGTVYEYFLEFIKEGVSKHFN